MGLRIIYRDYIDERSRADGGVALRIRIGAVGWPRRCINLPDRAIPAWNRAPDRGVPRTNDRDRSGTETPRRTVAGALAVPGEPEPAHGRHERAALRGDPGPRPRRVDHPDRAVLRS